MFSFTMRNLQRNPKDTAFFACSILMTSAIITIFFCIINNPHFGNTGMPIPQGYEFYAGSYAPSSDALINAFDQGIGNGIFTIMLSVLVIAICIMTIFFSHSFYLIGKTKDIGVMLMSGCSIAKLLRFLVTQNFIVVVLASSIGILLGMSVNPIMNAIIYSQMNLDASIFVFTWSSAGFAAMTMVLISVWLVILDYGFVIRSDSLDSLLKEESKMKGRNAKPMIKKCAYVGLYVASVAFILSYPIAYVSMYLMVYVGALIYFGAVNVFKFVIPDVLAYIARKYFSTNKHLVLSLANIQYSVANSSQLVTLILLSTTILYYYLCKFINDTATWSVVMFTYIVIMVLIITCIIYKLSSDALSKEPIYARMLCIGYLKEDIKKVIAQEIFGFYLMILLVAAAPLLSILFMYLAADVISVVFLLEMFGIFIVFLVIGAFVMYGIYMKMIHHIDVQIGIAQE